MFDIGFTELLVIGVVALLVLGPERLPRLARDVGRWVGRARRYVNHVREEIDREVELSELRRLRDEIEARAREVASEADSVVGAAEEVVRSTLDDIALPRSERPAVTPADVPVKPKRRASRKGGGKTGKADPGAAAEAAAAPQARKRPVAPSA